MRRLLLTEKNLGTHWSPGAQPFIRIIIRRQPSAVIGCLVKEQDAQVVRDALARLRARAGTAFAFAVAEIGKAFLEMQRNGVVDLTSDALVREVLAQRIALSVAADGGRLSPPWSPGLRAPGLAALHL